MRLVESGLSFPGIFYTVKDAPLGGRGGGGGGRALGGGPPVGTGPWVGDKGCPHNLPPCLIVSLSPPGCGLLREADLCTPRVGVGAEIKAG